MQFEVRRSWKRPSAKITSYSYAGLDRSARFRVVALKMRLDLPCWTGKLAVVPQLRTRRRSLTG